MLTASAVTTSGSIAPGSAGSTEKPAAPPKGPARPGRVRGVARQTELAARTPTAAALVAHGRGCASTQGCTRLKTGTKRATPTATETEVARQIAVEAAQTPRAAAVVCGIRYDS